VEDIVRLIVISSPDEKAVKPLLKVRKELNVAFGCSAALSYPIHVTLRTGFLVPRFQLDTFFQDWEFYLKNSHGPTIETEGVVSGEYSSEGRLKGFVGLSVFLSKELKDFHIFLLGKSEFQKGPQPAFHPHVTLLFDDFPPEKIAHALEWLEEWQESWKRPWVWRTDTVGMYVHENGFWVPKKVCPV